jgi:hypothetical protein
LDVLPQPSCLARRHVKARAGRHIVDGWLLVAGLGEFLGVAGALFELARHRLAEEGFGVADEVGVHVREDAVEIECDAKGQPPASSLPARRRILANGRQDIEF